MHAVDIIVPIYNASADVRQCLHALKQHTPAFARIMLADDASTDPALDAILRDFIENAAHKVEYNRQPSNLGFVGNVNAALRGTHNDAVILNSDTLVTEGWLHAIVRAAESDTRIASITPWSNNAEICSLPNLCQAAPVPHELGRVARALLKHSPIYPDLPTGVGFCMYMRRSVINAIGVFDQALFGRGYGEENDWCLRAAGMGFRNVLCDNAYVAHIGGRSFAQTGEKPGGENLRRLCIRYPHYERSVAEFIQRDPLKPLRHAICATIPELSSFTQ
jgi:GT2 family glycosyltransferase